MHRLFELVKSNNYLKIGIPAFFLLVLLIVISIAVIPSKKEKFQAGELREEPSVAEIDANDLYLPDEVSKLLELQPVFYRKRKEAWDMEDSNRYWTDPQKISIDIVRRNNEKLLEKMLSELP